MCNIATDLSSTLFIFCVMNVQISPTIHFYFSLNWLNIKQVIPDIFRHPLFEVVAVLKRPFSSLVNSICMQLILQFFCALVPIPLFSNFRHFGSIYLFEEWAITLFSFFRNSQKFWQKMSSHYVQNGGNIGNMQSVKDTYFLLLCATIF